MSPAAVDLPGAAARNSLGSDSLVSLLPHLRGVRWRINLCNLRSSCIDDLRRITADYRRRYAALRRRLLIDPHRPKDGSSSPNLVMDNPLSESPDSMWGRFFRNAELEKMLDQDLSRLYPEHGSYFQTPGCQCMLRRILLLWCLRHPEYGYRQGMHELLAPLLYVLHADLERLSEARKLYEDHFTDKFDDALFQENDLAYNFDFKRAPEFFGDDASFQVKTKKVVSLDELDPEIQTIVLLSDAYGAEGELGVVLSEKFMEHDVYYMFDALMSGVGGAVAMAEFFSPSTGVGSQSGIAPVIEASSALYHLLSVVDSSLYSHLVELGVEPQYFALRWLRVLFGREFPLEKLLIIWDEIFSFDNVKLGTADDNEPGSSGGVLNSRRGAFISAMAVSMILDLRASLLATEIATSCLQRLLNFPESIDLDKMIGKAKSMLALALDANASSTYAATGSYDQIKSSVVRGHSISFDSASAKTPLISAPERYWEEKWRDLHKAEELRKEKTLVKLPSTPKKGWTQKIKLRLSWSGFEPSLSPSKKDDKKEQRSARRSLHQDLSRQVGEEFDDKGDNEPSNQNGTSHDEPIVRVQDTQENSGSIEKTFSGQSTASGVSQRSLSPSKKDDRKEQTSARISLLQNLSRQLGEEFDDVGDNEPSNQNGPFHDEPIVRVQDAQENSGCIEKTFSGQSTASGEPEPFLSPPKRDGRKGQRSIRRSLLQDLSRQLGEEFDDMEDNEPLNQNDPFHDESIVRVHDARENSGGMVMTFSWQNSASGENFTILSDPGSPARGSDSLENDSEKSSVASCASHNMNEEPHQVGLFHSISEDPPTVSDPSDAIVSSVSDSPDLAAMGSKEKKSQSGKFQWLWKLGRQASGEEPSDKVNAQVIKSRNEDSKRSAIVAHPAEERNCSPVNVKGDVAEQNLICTLRNLGQSMLENIQVIESVFQQEIRQAGSPESLSRSALVEKGQVGAISALKELRKISNLLSEM